MVTWLLAGLSISELPVVFHIEQSIESSEENDQPKSK